MAKRRKVKILPRVTMLAMSRAELERFSSATEQVVSLAQSLQQIHDCYQTLLVRLEGTLSNLEARQPATRRRARRVAGNIVAGDVAGEGVGP